MKFSLLASGSKGNACYVETDNVKILIDAGISCTQIEKRLNCLGLTASDLNAIIITHEHADHIRGAGPLSRRYNLPIYINKKTYNHALKAIGTPYRAVFIDTGKHFSINSLKIETFVKCHDAADPFGLVLCCDNKRIGIVTDLGKSTMLVEDRLRGCNALIIEFNHDQDMLYEGPYPLDLKKRILGMDGHLSNNQAGSLLRNISDEKTRYVVLAHLSDINNDPYKAKFEALKVLEEKGLKNVNVLIGSQDEPGPLLNISV